jgi:hypothetical protein
MDQILAGAVGAVIGAVIAQVVNEVRLRRQHAQRKRTVTAIARAEGQRIGAALWRRLQQYPRSDSMAQSSSNFLKIVAQEYASVGSVFFGQLAHADVLDAHIVSEIVEAYSEMRGCAGTAAGLSNVGMINLPSGLIWDVKDRLADALGRLQRALVSLTWLPE